MKARTNAGFVPPPYPYDRLDETQGGRRRVTRAAASISRWARRATRRRRRSSTALASSNAERGYPASIGSLAYRRGGADWLRAPHSASPSTPATSRPASGTKEFVALAAAAAAPAHARPRHHPVSRGQLSDLRDGRDARRLPRGRRPGRRHSGASTCLAIDADDAERALALWVNTPGNPAGGLDDLDAAAEWGRANGVPVFSDECYVEFTWAGPPRTILRNGCRRTRGGALAVEAVEPRRRARRLLRRRSRARALPQRGAQAHGADGARARCRRPPVAAFGDDAHVDAQRERYRRRLERMRSGARGHRHRRRLAAGWVLPVGAGAGRRRWGLARSWPSEAGVLVSAGRVLRRRGARPRAHRRRATRRPARSRRPAARALRRVGSLIRHVARESCGVPSPEDRRRPARAHRRVRRHPVGEP